MTGSLTLHQLSLTTLVDSWLPPHSTLIWIVANVLEVVIHSVQWDLKVNKLVLTPRLHAAKPLPQVTAGRPMTSPGSAPTLTTTRNGHSPFALTIPTSAAANHHSHSSLKDQSRLSQPLVWWLVTPASIKSTLPVEHLTSLPTRLQIWLLPTSMFNRVSSTQMPPQLQMVFTLQTNGKRPSLCHTTYGLPEIKSSWTSPPMTELQSLS